MKNKFYIKGRNSISIIIALIVVGLIGGGLYYYFFRREIIPIEPKPTEELFGKDILTKPLANQDSLFALGTTNDSGDIDWKTILTISSVAKISPILIIENKKSVDDFSPKLFIEQYSPKKVYLHNYEYNFSNTEKIKTENINSQLYDSSNFVVISTENDYEISLAAASFAAYFNIPIFFSPLNNTEKDLIKKWKAEKIGIGIKEDVDHSLTVTETLDILKKNSDYLILTTSDDLNALKRPRFSLAAPILAGGRNGVVLNIENPTKESVKSKVNETTKDFLPSYLVVVGSEKNFPFIGYNMVQPGTYFDQDDDHQYFVNLYYWANYNSSNDYIPDAAVGAMTGYSVSDVSSLIARSLFYDRIAKSDKLVYWAPYGEPVLGASKIDPILDNDFSQKLINNFENYSSLDSKPVVINELKNSSVFIYSGHAWRNVLGNMSTAEVPTFKNPTFIFAFGCATLEPWNPGTLEEQRDETTVSYEMIKKGAVGIFGAAEIWFVSQEVYYGSDQRTIVENALNLPIGNSDILTQRMFDARYLYAQGGIPEGDNYYYKRYVYLLGDPKLKIRTDSDMNPNIFSEKIQMDLVNKSSEKMMCYTNAGCALCKTSKQECEQMSKEKSDKVVEFNFPLFLDSYVYSTDISSLGGIYYPRMNLRFFTSNPIKDIIIKADGRSIEKPYNTFLGKYCFSFDKQNYCPNLINQLTNYAFINPKTEEESVPQNLEILFVR